MKVALAFASGNLSARLDAALTDNSVARKTKLRTSLFIRTNLPKCGLAVHHSGARLRRHQLWGVRGRPGLDARPACQPFGFAAVAVLPSTAHRENPAACRLETHAAKD